MPEAREWILKKRCIECGKSKAWALFSPRNYYPDGSVRSVQSRCRPCATKANAEYFAEWASRNREARNRTKRAEGMRRRAAMRAEGTLGVRLPVEPFRAWLRARDTEPDALRRLAEMAGLHPETLRKVESRNKLVSLATVDAVLTACGEHPRDLYPDEYEEMAA